MEYQPLEPDRKPESIFSQKQENIDRIFQHQIKENDSTAIVLRHAHTIFSSAI